MNFETAGLQITAALQNELPRVFKIYKMDDTGEIFATCERIFRGSKNYTLLFCYDHEKDGPIKAQRQAWVRRGRFHTNIARWIEKIYKNQNTPYIR